MIFTSIQYVVFFTITLAVLWVLPSNHAKRLYLLAASYVFYAAWDVRFTLLLGGLTLGTWALCQRIERAGTQNVKKYWLVLSIVYSLSTLVAFKYYNFFVYSANSFFIPIGIKLPTLRLLLPIGISFIVFEVISYAVDVARGDSDPANSLLDFGLLVAFFPHLVAGPILKPKQFLPQLRQPILIKQSNLNVGMQTILMGLVKKLLIADRVAPFSDAVFSHPTSFSSGTVWLGVVAYAIQIYGDFSGYTDIAIGSAKCIGFDIPKNFRMPYLAENITDFWRRWHISLSTWLREYLYFPLGGNRLGVRRTYINLFIVMLLGGLWHGASWNFVFWGGMHGAGLATHKWLLDARKGSQRPLPRWTCGISWMLNLLFVCVAWVFFRSSDWANSWTVLTKMFHPDGKGIVWVSTALLIAVPLLIGADTFSLRMEQGKFVKLHTFWGRFAFCFVVLGLLFLAPKVATPFIYFQF